MSDSCSDECFVFWEFFPLPLHMFHNLLKTNHLDKTAETAHAFPSAGAVFKLTWFVGQDWDLLLLWFYSIYHSFQIVLVTRWLVCYRALGFCQSLLHLQTWIFPLHSLCLSWVLIPSADAPVSRTWSQSPYMHVSPLDFRPIGYPRAFAHWRVQESSWTYCHMTFFLVHLEWCSFQFSLTTNQSTLTLNEFSSWINVSLSGADTLEVE